MINYIRLNTWFERITHKLRMVRLILTDKRFSYISKEDNQVFIYASGYDHVAQFKQDMNNINIELNEQTENYGQEAI